MPQKVSEGRRHPEMQPDCVVTHTALAQEPQDQRGRVGRVSDPRWSSWNVLTSETSGCGHL